mgnify:FL=1
MPWMGLAGGRRARTQSPPMPHRPRSAPAPWAALALCAATALPLPALAASSNEGTELMPGERAAGGSGLLVTASSVWRHATNPSLYLNDGHWRVAFAPAAPHFRPSAEHQDVFAVALERQRPDLWLAGLSLFSNSFGQPSAYAYVGRRHEALMDVRPLFFQWSGGIIYGYRGQYADKVPMNVGGFSPGLLVGLGWQFDRRRSAVVHLLGDAALMFQFSVDLR